MEKICVYTCITGNYDNLKDVIVKEKGVDYVCFTNNREITSSTWKIIYIDDGILNNHYLSRKIKMLGHPYIDENYDLSIWIDASIIFKRSVNEFLGDFFDIKKQRSMDNFIFTNIFNFNNKIFSFSKFSI